MLRVQQVLSRPRARRSRLPLLALMALSASVWLGPSVPALAQDIYAWGERYGPTPVPVHNIGSISVLAAGWGHGLATNGNVVCAWGSNSSGQLGDGTTIDRLDPVAVHNLTGTGVFALAGGQAHSLAITADGTVWAWGQNAFGQLGDGTTTDRLEPVPIPTLSDVVAIAAGRLHSLALTSDGTVWAWGDNHIGQLGDGTRTGHLEPAPVLNLNDVVVAIATFSDHSLALTVNGDVWAWGFNGFGQLGDGTTTDRLEPVLVQNLPSDIFAVAAGGGHSLAMNSSGDTTWAWGFNLEGQLGDGTFTDRLTPVPVRNLTEISAIAAGGAHSLAIGPGLGVWAWGSNSAGQLGDGTFRPSPIPVHVQNLTDIIAIGAGNALSLAHP